MRSGKLFWVGFGMAVALLAAREGIATAPRAAGPPDGDQNKPEFEREMKRFGNRFPYSTSIRDADGSHLCGGTLIFPHIVLTAASCLTPEVLPVMHVGAGYTNEIDHLTFVRQAVDRWYPHPDWDANVANVNDIAVLVLNETVDGRILKNGEFVPSHAQIEFPNVQEAEAFLAEPELLLFSYGEKDDGQKTAEFLHIGESTVVANDRCPGLLEKQMCITGSAPCSGDEGGALVSIASFYESFSDTVVGVASIIADPCVSQEVTVVTRLAPYVSWLNQMACDTAPPEVAPTLTCPGASP